MSISKIQDWEFAFNDFIDQSRNKAFAYGSWDCCLFSNACLKAITGKDIIPKTLKWKDEATAYEAIKKYNGTLGKSVAKACKKAGMREIPKSFVQKGDLVIYKEENELVGIWDGYAVLTPTDDCLGVKNNVDILEVWRA